MIVILSYCVLSSKLSSVKILSGSHLGRCQQAMLTSARTTVTVEGMVEAKLSGKESSCCWTIPDCFSYFMAFKYAKILIFLMRIFEFPKSHYAVVVMKKEAE